MDKQLMMLIFMFISHYLADFVLQTDGIAQWKQKKWWDLNYPQKLYKYDWIVCMAIHSIFWSLCLLLPAIYLELVDSTIRIVLLLLMNSTIHFVVDHMKANRHSISLSTDQLFHVFQIFITYDFIVYWR